MMRNLPSGKERLLWAIPVSVNAVALAVWTAVWLLGREGEGFIDLEVYRIGIHTLGAGGDLYGQLPETAAGAELPFIYPPFAVAALAPFAFSPWGVASAGLILASIGSLAAATYVVLRRMTLLSVRRAVWVTATATPVMLSLEPVSETLMFGQVNLLLLGLVAVDCLARTAKWPRGMLVGLAAAIKLTPAVFVLYFLIRREYRAAATAAVSGAVATAVMFLVLPHESVKYWFGGFGQMSGLSGSPYAANQSIQAVLARLGTSEPMFTVFWLVLSGLVLAVTVVAMRESAHIPPLALVCNAMFALLVSPISWSHHWVWLAPALVVGTVLAVERLSESKGWLVVPGVIASVAVVGAHRFFPNSHQRELEWLWWQQIAGSSYALLGIAVLVLAMASRSARPGPEVPVPMTRSMRKAGAGS
ncbi:glycosyltransferase 87 family protein [Gordonia zhaorongruii]|uniref:glycosyltransferase 87 family protein n=1 Tax=Gordonia zhaorongruii TaxID=2597659 RepID=UPI0010510D7C|nr:glycosyltransferase 87 family protein [Gordonia zhaorongruii]